MEFSEATLTKLTHIADAIEAAPAQFRMETWISNFMNPGMVTHGMLARGCNTAGCIAGWVLSEYLPDGEPLLADFQTAPTRALQLLEVEPDSEQAEYLKAMFADRSWWKERDYIGAHTYEEFDGETYVDEDYDGLEDITAEIAVTAIRDLVDGEWL